MKILISIFALDTSHLPLQVQPSRETDRGKDRGRLREGRRHLGCCDQNVRREKAII